MSDAIIIQENKAANLHDKALRKEVSERLIVRVIKDDEDVDEEEVLDLVREAKKNDTAPIKEAEAFPEIKKSAEPKEVIKDKELQSEPAETERKPARKSASKTK